MIDTIKVRVKLTHDLQKTLKNYSTETIKYNHKEGVVMFRFLNASVNLGSFDRYVNFFTNENGYLTFELSITKFALGHNVYLDYDWSTAFASLYSTFRRVFGEFPPLSEWDLRRIDLCYAWRLKDQEEVKNTILLLSKITVPRKKPYLRPPESVMWVGRTYSLKFYAKKPEFFAHDYKIIKAMGKQALADDLYVLADGVLRFEVSMRRASLEYYLKKRKNDTIVYTTLTHDFVIKYLCLFLGKFFSNMDTVHTTYIENKDRLIKKYSATRAVQLMAFWMLLQQVGRKELESWYARETVSRNIGALRDAGVSINISETNDFKVNLTIPSLDVVNSQSLPAEAGATW